MSDLTQMYDDIKSDVIKPAQPIGGVGIKIGPGGLDQSPAAMRWRAKAAQNAECLTDDCRKHILLDIYCKILSPTADKSWVDGNQGVVASDIDKMLAAKGMTATQYLTSCYEATHAPFVEYLLNATDAIGRAYMEAQEEILKDAQDKDIDVPEPEDPSIDDDDVSQSLVDIKADTEFQDFIKQLEKKTVDKIVNDISDIINDKKQENDMSFNPQGESTVAPALEYVYKQHWGEEITEAQRDEFLLEAVREATLHQLDVVFEQGTYHDYVSKIKAGRGAVITESTKPKKKEEKPKKETKKDTKLSVKIWGKKFNLPIKFEGDEPTNNQERAIEKFQNDLPAELSNEKKVTDFIIKHNSSELGGTTVSDVHKYVTPKFVCVKKSNSTRGVAVVCKYKFEKDKDLAIIFNNEKFKKIELADKED